MSPTQERKRQRRTYLIRMGAAYTKAGLASILSLTFFIAALTLSACCLFAFGFGDFSRKEFLVILTAILFCGVVSWRFLLVADRTREEYLQLPYIPPVTTDSLPAEEVLVRGSEEPAQEQGQLLLRGTDSSSVTAEQELLRSSQGQE